MLNNLLISSITALSVLACSAQKTADSKAKKTEVTSTLKEAPAKPAAPPKTVESKSATPKQTSTSQTTQKMAGIVYFKEGESVFLKDQEMSFFFKKMLEDSRCPKGVNCVWEGVATAEVELMGSYTRPVKVKLSTVDSPQKGYNNKAIFNGYQYTLVQADPYPTPSSGFTANSGRYVIGVRIDKVAENRIEPSTR
ncbi:MAG: hypothetical protein K0M63_10425 [Weeksellaceae bacterium]|nr:hypothetical protein [Weeksellaceae bacterium]